MCKIKPEVPVEVKDVVEHVVNRRYCSICHVILLSTVQSKFTRDNLKLEFWLNDLFPSYKRGLAIVEENLCDDFKKVIKQSCKPNLLNFHFMVVG